MISNPAFVTRLAPLLASAALLMASAQCCESATPPSPPIPSETPTCSMHFTSPNSGAALAGNGPVDFSWTSVPNASYYIFTVNLPGNGGQSSWNMTSTSRTLYMENFTTSGSYSAHVQARDTSADILCEANLNFSKDPKAKIEKNNGSSPAQVNPVAPVRSVP
jgi:hypothetical protein